MKNENVLINNINNLLIKYTLSIKSNTLLVDILSYLRSQRSNQTKLEDLQFLSHYALFSKNWCTKLLKKNLECENK